MTVDAGEPVRQDEINRGEQGQRPPPYVYWISKLCGKAKVRVSGISVCGERRG